jgi:hypothetical protein
MDGCPCGPRYFTDVGRCAAFNVAAPDDETIACPFARVCQRMLIKRYGFVCKIRCFLSFLITRRVLMRRYLFLILLLVSFATQAMTSLRVGSRVLTIGDTAAKVLELMGEPTVRALVYQLAKGRPGNHFVPGEQWQYPQEGKTIVITMVGGRATNFETIYE